mmetsp:Transcript_35074/g.109619  ORF Transcript_35074/g.109619 Transcript_35074/m.109619 type:complete len:122 (+) Transcript_35074:117-482(+)
MLGEEEREELPGFTSRRSPWNGNVDFAGLEVEEDEDVDDEEVLFTTAREEGEQLKHSCATMTSLQTLVAWGRSNWKQSQRPWRTRSAGWHRWSCRCNKKERARRGSSRNLRLLLKRRNWKG